MIMEIIIPGQLDLTTGEATLYPASDVKAADYLLKLKSDNQTDMWPVIDAVIDVWERKNQNTWEATIVEIKNERDSRANKHGANKKAGLRQTLDIPMQVEAIIRRLYSPTELPFDKRWYKELWKRYPAFRVAQEY